MAFELTQSSVNSDVEFMEIIRQYPAIYDKSSKACKDKRIKANCWKMVADILNVWAGDAERRYKTIRTAFTRYLAKREGKSGFGVDDVGQIDPKYENLRWLITFIRSRPSSSNFQRKNVTTGNDEEFDQDFQKCGPSNGSACSDELLQTEINEEEPNAECRSVGNKRILASDVKPSGAGKKFSMKEELEKTDKEIKQAMITLEKSVEFMQEQSKKSDVDEDTHYCLIIAARLKRFDARTKAIARHSIERVLFDLEFGYQQVDQSSMFTKSTPNVSYMAEGRSGMRNNCNGMDTTSTYQRL